MGCQDSPPQRRSTQPTGKHALKLTAMVRLETAPTREVRLS